MRLFFISNDSNYKCKWGTVLPFLAIYRQIRDFGPTFGDKNLALAIDRQSPKIRDFQPQNWRFWRKYIKPGDIGDFKAQKVEISQIFY